MSEDVAGTPISQVLGLVKEAVGMLFTDGLWMTAEVLMVGNGKHRYLELVEYDSNRREIAKGRGTIWEKNVGLLAKFEKTTGRPLTKGMKILFQARPTFHPIYGLSLDIQDINPVFTVGDMEARLNEFRASLKAKGEWDLNRSLKSPVEFCRLAVIAPPEAAGLGDFRIGADKLQSLGLCEFHYFPSAFQGNNVGDQIIGQLVKILEIHKTVEPFDAVVLIRGGGDKAGLYQLNELRLCRAICRFPVPIMVGIGHERDKVLIDEVANHSFATPSLLGAHISTTIIRNAQRAKADFQKLLTLANLVVTRSKSECQMLRSLLVSKATRQLEQAKSQLNAKHVGLVNGAAKSVAHADAQVKDLARTLSHRAHTATKLHRDTISRLREDLFRNARASLTEAQRNVERNAAFLRGINPVEILARGYGFVKTEEKYIRNVSDLSVGDHLDVTLHDGTISVEVKAIKHEQK